MAALTGSTQVPRGTSSMGTKSGLAVAALAAVIFAVSGTPAVPAAAAIPTVDVRLVSDISPDGGSDPRDLVRVGSLVYFTATDGVHGRELWATDGTDAGTRLIRDIYPGTTGSSPRRLSKVGPRLYFTAMDGRHGRELWVSDGTTAGTRLVRDLNKGAAGSTIRGIADGSGTAYFARGQRELWRTDGSAKSTRLVRKVSGGLELDGAIAVGKDLFFGAEGLWRSKGTKATTVRLTAPGGQADELTRYRGAVYFRHRGDDGYGAMPLSELWRSDGTKSGTKRVGPAFLEPNDLRVMAGRLYFNTDRLFSSDGTAAGTGPVKPRVRALRGMVKDATRLWTTDVSQGWAGSPDELWSSDGTASGTDLAFGGTGDWFASEAWDGSLECASLDGRIWFAAGPGDYDDSGTWAFTDHELWSSDGTRAGTAEIADINLTGSAFPRDFVRLGRSIVFSADDGRSGRELWRLSLP